MRLYDYAASGNCYKARLLFALLSCPYERVSIDIFAGDTLTSEYAAINPARETPVLELDDGTRLVQSNAILWYLADKSPFLPSDALSRARVVQWLMFEQEYVIPGIAAPRFWKMTGRGDPETIETRLEHGRTGFTLLEGHLSHRDFVVDRPSIADIAIFGYTHVAPDAGLDLSKYPSVVAWLTRVSELLNFVDDLIPYPSNAHVGRSRSIYD